MGRDLYPVVLLRHSESTWDKENRLTGWTDVELAREGLQVADKVALLRQRLLMAYQIKKNH